MAYAHRIGGEHKIKLDDFDTNDTAGLSREEAEEETARLIEEMVEMQELSMLQAVKAFS